MKFVKPEIEIIKIEDIDVLTNSPTVDIGGNKDDYFEGSY